MLARRGRWPAALCQISLWAGLQNRGEGLQGHAKPNEGYCLILLLGNHPPRLHRWRGPARAPISMWNNPPLSPPGCWNVRRRSIGGLSPPIHRRLRSQRRDPMCIFIQVKGQASVGVGREGRVSLCFTLTDDASGAINGETRLERHERRAAPRGTGGLLIYADLTIDDLLRMSKQSAPELWESHIL